MTTQAAWQRLYEAFDPERPAELVAWRADRPRSPAAEIVRDLDASFADARFLLLGTIGTGKTTELLRIRDARREQDLVVFLDLVQHFSRVVRDEAALQRIGAWEICFLAGLALIAECRHRYGFEFPALHLEELSRAWRDLAKSTESPEGPAEVAPADLIAAAAKAVAVGMGLGPVGVAGADAVGAAVRATGWRIPLGQARRVPQDQEEEVQTLLGSVNTLIGLARQHLRRVVFVIDGLDRIRSLEQAARLLVDSQMLGQLDCPLVVCAPFALRHDPTTTAVRRFVPKVLVNLPVRDQADPARPGPGVAFFREVCERRVAAIDAPGLITPEQIERLAFASGGRARDFVLFVRDLALAGHHQGLAQATTAAVDTVLEDHRRRREHGLNADHIALLEAVARDPEHHLPGGERALDLLTLGALLPYPDGTEWFYPHPLLTKRLVKTG